MVGFVGDRREGRRGNVSSGMSCSRIPTIVTVRAQSRIVAAIGMQDHIIVETADAVLVAHRDRVQDVKEIVGQAEKEGRDEALLHRLSIDPGGITKESIKPSVIR